MFPQTSKEFAFLRYRPAQQPGDHPDVRVEHDASWSHCGPLLQLSSSSSSLPASLDEFAAATFTGPILPRLLPFLDFVNAALAASRLEHYLLTIRASTPTHEFDRPRWHTDDYFFSGSTTGSLLGTRRGLSSQYGEDEEQQQQQQQQQESSAGGGTSWKMCTTLLGPPTLFIPPEHQSQARATERQALRAASTDHKCVSIRCVGCASAADVVREELATKLAQFGAQRARPGECAWFRVGRDVGAVHSEPRMSEGDEGDGHGAGGDGRIFVNVVPGTEEELRGMAGKWGMGFPRQWWVGSHTARAHGDADQ